MDIKELLQHIPPDRLDYQDWLSVGMAMKHEGLSWQDWDSWSRADPRYRPGECQRKWEGFNGSETPVTGGSIVKLARDFGWDPGEGVYDWEDTIFRDGYSEKSSEGIPIREPETWDPVEQVMTYLSALFDRSDYVGYVTEVWHDDKDKAYPTKGAYDRTAGELLDLLAVCKGDLGAVIGDYDPAVGAWIRFNPLDGKGVNNQNVADFRYALVESDTMALERQNALIRELELPVALLVYSGGKSLHAIVKIDAPTYEEYRRRVDYLYKVCRAHGLEVDRQDRNPSRLSRLPGVTRGDHKQFILDRDLGKASFEEWRDYMEQITDDLPDAENAADFWDDIPPLRPALIEGVLRQGHKLLLSGPSKAGKSFALIALAIAIAEGKPWLGFSCARGRVWYINLELDDISCKHRIHDVYTALGIEPSHLGNIDVWNLRGRAVPMDKLAPSIIRRARQKNYTAIIIDPIYKVITGDENSAEQMAHFCNQFDRVCAEAGCAVIYCHHHSKGAQGGKRSMDRASGSGVFARDPDAILDLIELPVSEQLQKTEQDKAVCAVCKVWLTRFMGERYDEVVSQDDEQSRSRMLELCRTHLRSESLKLLHTDIQAAEKKVQSRTAWRVEGTLREFPRFSPKNVWFDHPVHRPDSIGVLKDIDPEETWQKNFKKKKTNEERENDRKASIELIFDGQETDGAASIKDMAASSGKSEDTIRRHLKEHGGFWIEDGKCGRKA